MTTPVERFKDAYQNHRWNPFTDADLAADKEEAHVAVPSSSPFCLQLLEVPRKDTPSSVTVYCHTDGISFAEVLTSPTQGQFRVDYPDPDGEGTGMIEFNSADNGKDITVNYKATGSPIVSEILDTKVSYPAGTPAANQVIIFQSGAPVWAYNPIRMFHEGPVVYHASGEDESCLLFDFKKSANESKVFLRLKGAKLHQGFYTEVASHQHGCGDLRTESAGGHSHPAGSLAGSQPTHCHPYNPGDYPGDPGNPAGNDAVSISGSTGDAESHFHNVSSGQTAVTATTPKTYPDSLKVFIDGTDRTAALLTLSGLAKLGDGTGTHGFVVTGTGDMDITTYVSAAGYHEIKVTEPTATMGGRVLLNLELY